MSKKNEIKILNFSGSILFKHSYIDNTIKITVEMAVMNKVDLYGANLRDANLCGADLHGANLHGANLHDANLRDANLHDANLHDANLRDANLCGANLYGANLYGANLYGANLRNANLYGANLYGADLHGVDLRGVDLRGIDLHGVDLHGANLYGVDLHGVDLYGTNLCSANLYGADLPKQFNSNLNILKIQKNKLFAYKYLNRDMTSPYQNFKYEIGKEYISKNADNDETVLCGPGINIATLQWCLQDTCYDLVNKVYVLIEFDPKDLVIPHNSDGKFRIKEGGLVKFIKILTKKEIEETLNL